jgi:hypothetical protein
MYAGIFGPIVTSQRRHPLSGGSGWAEQRRLGAELVWPASLRYVHWVWVRFAALLGSIDTFAFLWSVERDRHIVSRTLHRIAVWTPKPFGAVAAR